MNYKDIFAKLCGIAPIELSDKLVKLEDGYREYPEYESAKRLAVETGKPLWEILNHEGKSGEFV